MSPYSVSSILNRLRSKSESGRVQGLANEWSDPHYVKSWHRKEAGSARVRWALVRTGRIQWILKFNIGKGKKKCSPLVVSGSLTGSLGIADNDGLDPVSIELDQFAPWAHVTSWH